MYAYPLIGRHLPGQSNMCNENVHCVSFFHLTPFGHDDKFAALMRLASHI
jgi:hypothetical protein